MTNPEDRRDESQPLLASTSSSASAAAAAANKRRTVQSAKHHDLWATILFFVNLIIFGTVYYHVYRLAYGNYDGTVRVKSEWFGGDNDVASMALESMGRGQRLFAFVRAVRNGWLDDNAFGILVATTTLVAALATAGVIALLKIRPAIFIKVSAVLAVVMALVGGVAGFIVPPRQYVWSTISILLAGVVIFKNKYIRSKVPLTRWLIVETITNTRRYWGVIPVAVVSIAIITGVSIFFDKALYLFYAVYSDKGLCHYNDEGLVVCDSYQVIPATAYVLFTLIWVVTSLSHVVYVILTRVLGSAYYIKASQRDASSSTTIKAVKFATIHSFGTISLTSLVVTLLVAFYPLILNLKTYAFTQKGILVLYVLQHSSIILGTLFRALAYIILVHVALFNRSFKEGVQASRALLQDRLWSAIVNYGLLASTLSVLGGLILLLTIGYALAFVFIFKPSFYKDHADDEKARAQVLAAISGVATIIGALVASIPESLFISGAISTYVALGENPETLQRLKPDLYAELRAECPEVGRDVHGGVVGQ